MNEALTPFDPRVRELLQEAARWRLLGRLFECPSPEWREDLTRLAGEVDDEELRAAAEHAVGRASEGEYHVVFGPGGPAPPREVSYYESVELGSLMSELAAYYAAFGFRALPSEPPDHVAVETAFMAYLRLKEAYARAMADPERAATTASAAARFRDDHLATLASPLAVTLSESGIDYLARAGRRLLAYAGERRPLSMLPILQEETADDDSGNEFRCCET